MNAYKWGFKFFRCGVASLRKETDRYERLPLEERTCHICIYIFCLVFFCLFVCVYTVYTVKICLLFYFFPF